MASRRRREPAVSADARAAFLAAIAGGWSATAAAEAAGTRRQRFYELAAVDERFRAAWEEADQSALDLIRDTIRKRIIDGIPDFRLDKDGKEHPTRVFSDRLLELAARRLPELRESQRLEVTGTVHGALDVGVTVEHDFQAILETLEAAGVLVRGPAAGAAAAEAAALERKALERGDGGSTQPDGESA